MYVCTYSDEVVQWPRNKITWVDCKLNIYINSDLQVSHIRDLSIKKIDFIRNLTFEPTFFKIGLFLQTYLSGSLSPSL